MKRNFLVALLFVFSSYSYSQKLVSMEDFEDNKDSYVGKNIKILIHYDNTRSQGCQLRRVCGKFNDNWIQWKCFTWFYDNRQPLYISIPYKFFENEGILMPNVIDRGDLEAVVYVYRGNNYIVGPKDGYAYGGSSNNEVISMELVSIKRAK
jgi:hypothetical protein